MKRSLFATVLVMSAFLACVSAQAPGRGQGGARPNIFAPAATANGPLADVMNYVVKACNDGDADARRAREMSRLVVVDDLQQRLRTR